MIQRNGTQGGNKSSLTVIDERVVLGKEFRVYGDCDNPYS